MSVRKRVIAKSPVRENRTQGSVGGSPSNGRSYPHTKKLLFCSVCLLCFGLNATDKTSQLLTAYAEQRWGKVRSLLRKTEPSAQRKLIRAFYLLNAPRGDKNEGLEQLKILSNDKQLPENIRLQAMLTYGRNVELMQMRPDLYQNADSLGKPSEVYDEIIQKFPASKEACYAIIYKTRTDKNFAELESFLTKPKLRNKDFLGIVHWFAANEYIVLRRAYKQAVRHLIAAEKYGIANPRFLTVVRFQIGRIYDSKLHDKANAMKYYQSFIKQYPSSLRTMAVKRYMKKLGGAK